MALGKRLINTGVIAADAACSTDSVQAFGADSAFSSNIALYQLDSDGGTTNNVPDTTTNYNGTASNVTYATGKFGNAGVFNGSSSIDTNISTLTSNGGSVSLWVKTTEGTQSAFFGGQSPIANRFYFGVRNSNFWIGAGDTQNSYNIDASSLLDGNWHHVVLTLDGSTAKYYLDGNSTPVDTISYTSGGTIGVTPLIGALDLTGTVGSYTNGNIDQVRIFDKAISAEDVATLYAETTSTASDTNPLSDGSGVALYSLDYDASDAGGYYDGTPTDVDFGVGGKTNYGARFNGSSSYINLGTGSSGLSGVLNQKVSQSVSFWMNTAFTGISGNSIIYSVYAGAGISLNVYYLTGGTLYFLTRYNNNSITFTTTQTFNDSQWHHVAVTIDVPNSKRKIYIDNTLTDTETLPAAAYGGTGTTGVALGTNGNFNSQYYKGDLDQVRIFSKALSSDEVDTLYNNGDGETACVYTSTTDIVDYPTGTTPVAYYKLDNSSEDYSTGTNDGTDTNVEYRFGRFGQAAVFNGSSSYIDTNYTLTSDTSLSFSFWLNVNDYASNDHYIFSDLSSSATDRRIGIRITSSGYFSVDVSSNGTNIDTSIYSSAISKNQWIHYVVVLDGTSYELYQDGYSVHTDTLTQTLSAGGRSLIMGRAGDYNPATNFYYDGSIDQVRIYSTALDSDQVEELYNEKPEVDTSNFKTVLWDGTSAENYISQVGMDLETSGGLVWIKQRSLIATDHRLFDSVRGVTQIIASSNTNAQGSNSETLKSFEANGFVLGTNTAVNDTGDNFVAWVWKSGQVDAVVGTGTGVTNVSVSANTEAGFSIVKYTGGNSASDTVNHGLTDAEMIILKDLDDGTNNWRVWHKDLSANHWLYLNLPNAQASNAIDGGIRNVDSNSFGFIQTSGNTIEGVNSNVSDYIAYVWKSVAGYSKIGSYSGDGNANHEITDVGFQPNFLLIKNIGNSSTDWLMYDNRRGTTALAPNQNFAESTYGISYEIEFISNGFKIIDSNNATNQSGTDNFIYMAFK